MTVGMPGGGPMGGGGGGGLPPLSPAPCAAKISGRSASEMAIPRTKGGPDVAASIPLVSSVSICNETDMM